MRASTFFQAKSIFIVLDLSTSSKHRKEKFICIRSPIDFRVDLIWKVIDGRANEVTRVTAIEKMAEEKIWEKKPF